MDNSDDQANLEFRLGNLSQPVRLVFFTQTFGCDSCFQARRLVDQLASLSEQVTVEEYNLILDKEKVEEFGVDRAPAIVVMGEKNSGIRYYGLPSGYEVASLIEAVSLVGTGDVGLSQSSLNTIKKISCDVDIKVFVTPT